MLTECSVLATLPKHQQLAAAIVVSDIAKNLFYWKRAIAAGAK